MRAPLAGLTLLLFFLGGCAQNMQSTKSDPLPFMKKAITNRQAFFIVYDKKKRKIGSVETQVVIKAKKIKMHQLFKVKNTRVVSDTELQAKTGSLIQQKKRVKTKQTNWNITTKISGLVGLIAIDGTERKKVRLELGKVTLENETLPLLLEQIDFARWQKGKRKLKLSVLQPQLGQIVPFMIVLRGKRGKRYRVDFIVEKKKAQAYYAAHPPYLLEELQVEGFHFKRALYPRRNP